AHVICPDGGSAARAGTPIARLELARTSARIVERMRHSSRAAGGGPSGGGGKPNTSHWPNVLCQSRRLCGTLRRMTRYGGLSLGLLLLALTIVLLEAGLILLLGITLAKRRRADRALRESESRFRIVADSLPVLIWMSGVDRLCTFFNKPWLDFTGRTAEQEIGNGWGDGVPPGNLEGCLKGYVEPFDARRPFVLQYRLRRHDGEYRFISDHGVPRYDTQGG